MPRLFAASSAARREHFGVVSWSVHVVPPLLGESTVVSTTNVVAATRENWGRRAELVAASRFTYARAAVFSDELCAARGDGRTAGVLGFERLGA
ncbi:MAG: hypothetical protein ACRDZP_00845 [Acidimicrobiales bacterium]